MHPVDAFKADPERFIRKNMLTLNSSLDDPAPDLIKASGAVSVTLIDWIAEGGGDMTASRVRNRKGLAKLFAKTNKSMREKAVNYYAIVPAVLRPNQPSFEAYICPYVDDSIKTKFLGTAARFMFTGDMDGCTFGVGMPTANGGVLVGHANAGKKAIMDASLTVGQMAAPQRTAQWNKLAKRGLGGKIVDPDIYRGDSGGLKAITIGIRVGSVWKFWYQQQDHGSVQDDLSVKMMSLTPLG